jgi:hypothetical protein
MTMSSVIADQTNLDRQQVNDTDPETQAVLNRLYAAMTVGQKMTSVVNLQRTAQKLAGSGLRARQADLSSEQLAMNWRKLTLSMELALQLPGSPLMNEPLDAWDEVRRVAKVLTDLSIRFALGGSLASSVHGVPRFTNDADLCVEPFPGKDDALVQQLGADYYVSLPAIREANAKRRSFNIVRLASSFKLDLFVQKGRPYDQQVLARAKALDESGTEVLVPVLSPEDILLHKFEWYRLGNEISDRQWNDILGILRTQGTNLDRNYVLYWGKILGVADLVGRATQEM